IKVYHGIERKHLRAVAKEARRAELAVVGHAPHDVSPRRAAKAGLVNFSHGMELLRGHDEPGEAIEESRRMARALKRRGVWVTPNLIYLDALARQQEDPSVILADPDFARLHPAMRQWFHPEHNPYAAQGEEGAAFNRHRLEYVKVLIKVLHEEGVPLLAGSDALAAGVFPQSALFAEFRLLEEAGLTPEEALAAATVRGGEFIRTHIDPKARLGVIAPGARADLLLVAEDPRRKVLRRASIRGVIAGGALHGGWGEASGRLEPPPARSAAARAVSRIAGLVAAGKVGEAQLVYDAVRKGRPGEILFHRFAFLNIADRLMFEDGEVTDDRLRLEQAAAAYRMYTDTYPELHIGHIRLAQALAALERCAQANAALDWARSLAPAHPLIEETAEACD
ncbi:MAG: amidohydrolase family protein, partial [Alphaproteobacteria bacterium]